MRRCIIGCHATIIIIIIVVVVVNVNGGIECPFLLMTHFVMLPFHMYGPTKKHIQYMCSQRRERRAKAVMCLLCFSQQHQKQHISHIILTTRTIQIQNEDSSSSIPSTISHLLNVDQIHNRIFIYLDPISKVTLPSTRTSTISIQIKPPKEQEQEQEQEQES